MFLSDILKPTFIPANQLPGSLGVFGTGQYQVFGVYGPATFTVPASISSIRIRIVGAGGSGVSSLLAGAPGTASSVSGTGISITAGGGGGGTASTSGGVAGAAATGAGLSVAFAGGTGAVGFWSGTPSTSCGGGGGGAGSQMGTGGVGIGGSGNSSAGGGVGGASFSGSVPHSPWSFGGADYSGNYNLGTGYSISIPVAPRFPFDAFFGASALAGGPGGTGCGGVNTTGLIQYVFGGTGAGGAGGQVTNSTCGGIGGGGGGLVLAAGGGAGGGGGGYGHGVYSVAAGLVLTVTVGQGGQRASGQAGGDGIVIIEW